MSESLILEKLDNLEKNANKLNLKVDKIEIAVGLIAVQSERINNLSIQTQSLWLKYDKAFGDNGTIARIKQFQVGCPRESIKNRLKNQDKTISNQWIALGLLATVLTGCLIKILMTG